ncbi:MAG: collagen-like protein, partial [Oleispira sp.]|nr:collagen-like protein [Oleispira sp.]
GVQGKLGDAGAQGVQGKLGDTGAKGEQGVQGKLGDTGAQGVQGKLGDTGDQGVQGKLGDTGAKGDQGVQGKLGDTGAQGVQGKLGDTGPRGIQGLAGQDGSDGIDGVGTQGEPGTNAVDGVGTNLMCFSTDQTIGTSGKHMGLGTQAGDHDSVGVISPFGADAEVITLVVKAAIGKTARSGVARLFHDAPGGVKGGEMLGEDCVLELNSFKSTCLITLDVGTGGLGFLDSLSVFIKADSGSFEGGSACVLIDPDGVNSEI